MNAYRYLCLLVITWSALLLCHGQTGETPHGNDRLTPAEFRNFATTCAPEVPLVTLRAIVRAESAFHPYALSLDYPRLTAKEHGLKDGAIFLARQPRNLSEARSWAHWFVQHGRSVSIGLTQISTKSAARLGLTVDELFDPCTNIQAAARILTAEYEEAAATLGEGQVALQQALSQYNSGSPVVGFDNGYVAGVIDGEFHSRQLP